MIDEIKIYLKEMYGLEPHRKSTIYISSENKQDIFKVMPYISMMSDQNFTKISYRGDGRFILLTGDNFIEKIDLYIKKLNLTQLIRERNINVILNQ